MPSPVPAVHEPDRRQRVHVAHGPWRVHYFRENGIDTDPKTQASLPTEDSALVLLFSLLASGQVKLRRIDGWQDACGGDTGPAGKNGDTGASGSAGQQGPAGPAGPAGASIAISDVAKHGLAISPVPLTLDGLTGDQIEQVGQGSYLTNAVGDCNTCHTTDPSRYLAGGVPFGGAPAPFTVTSRNLTPDAQTGLPANISTVDQFVSAMRTGADYHGVPNGGTPTQTMLVMPWDAYRWMSTADLKAIYAYLKVIPPVKNAVGADTKPAAPPGPAPTHFTDGDWTTPPALPAEVDAQGTTIPDPNDVLRGLALNPLQELKVPTDANDQALFARGAYLFTAIAACSGCHTNTQPPGSPTDFKKFLTGGQVFLAPPPFQPVVHVVRSAAANLIGPTNGFFNKATGGFATFLALITEGVHAEDPTPAPVAFPMPWPIFRRMTLSDLQAIYVFMHTVATQYGPTLADPTLDKVVPSAAVYCDATNPCSTGFACSASSGPGECLNQTCTPATVLNDCAVCQSCSAGKCVAPAATDACLAAGY